MVSTTTPLVRVRRNCRRCYQHCCHNDLVSNLSRSFDKRRSYAGLIGFNNPCGLHGTFILSVVLYEAETRYPTRQLVRNLDMFYQWYLRRILCISCRAAFLMKRSADVLISHTSSVPPALSSSVTLHVLIHLWTTVEPLGTVWPLCKGIETADRADRVTPGSGPLNPI